MPPWPAGSEAHAVASGVGRIGGIVAQGGEPGAGIDEDQPVPPRREDAIGDEATSIGWLVATIGSIALLGLIAWIWLRLGRAAQRTGEPDGDAGSSLRER